MPTAFPPASSATRVARAGAIVLLAACGGGGGSTPPAPLSADQKIYESLELHGGTYTLGWSLPYGGGTLVSGTDYFYSDSTGGLSVSPSLGPQTEQPATATLDPLLALPARPPTRYLAGGQILTRGADAQRRVSYAGSAVQIEYLADDGQTGVETAQFSGFAEVALGGAMVNSAEELQAQYPITDWANANNFIANAAWQAGAAYTKRQGALAADAYFAQDCTNVYPAVTTTGTSLHPCRAASRLEDIFPIVLYGSNGHPIEADALTDGAIGTVQGLRMWVASAPIPLDQNATTAYRIYFEAGGNVYMGHVWKSGTAFGYNQSDGSVVSYTIGLNQAAVQSVQAALITGATQPGSELGSTALPGTTLDLFGVGGHAVNGALAPVDLATHYGLPAGLDGTGQTIAIVDAPGSGNVADDLNVYSQAFKLPPCNAANPCFTNIVLGSPVPPASTDWGVEVALDTQMVHAIAPGAHILLVTAASASGADLLAAVNFAAAQPGVTAVTLSATIFGEPVASYQNEDTLLAGFQANQGTIFFAASGDGGNSWIGTGYPASSPYVTAVGGTRIVSVAWAGPSSEVAWRYSGGGASSYAAMPAWQSAYVGSAIVSANGAMRAAPDVAAVADGQHSAVAIYYKQRWLMSGGTSAGAPIWAGISALFGQYLAGKNASLAAKVKATPGGFNGLLYQSALTQGANPGFHDIVAGSNDLSGVACAVCAAAAGFDDVTGIGTPDVGNLFTYY